MLFYMCVSARDRHATRADWVRPARRHRADTLAAGGRAEVRLGRAPTTMQLKQLLGDDDAVSPVIGVILMVAITVILAAVIGTFVLGLGDQVSDTTPQASITFDFESSASVVDSGASLTAEDGDSDVAGNLTIVHDGGDSLDRADINITDGSNSITAETAGFSTEISAGSSVEVSIDNDDTVRVVFASSDSGDSATLGEFDGPDA
jgi:flagellin-like protein